MNDKIISTVLAGILATILLTSAIVVPYANAYSSVQAEEDDKRKERHDEDRKEKRLRDNVDIASLKAKHDQRAGIDEVSSLGSLTMTAQGLAVKRTEDGIKTADATLEMSGTVRKVEGSHARVSLDGTLHLAGDEYYDIRAEGKVKTENHGFGVGVIHIKGKAGSAGASVAAEDDRGQQRFMLKGLILPSNEEATWRLVVDPAAKIGSHVKIFGLIGKVHFEVVSVPENDEDENIGELDHLEISSISNQIAGSEFTFTVKAVNADGNTIPSYNGTVTLTTDGGASPAGNASPFDPNPYTFLASDDGKHEFKAKMYNAKQNVTITATGSDKTGTSNKFNVAPAAIASVTVSPSAVTVESGGMASFEAEAFDEYGNQVATTFEWTLSPADAGTLDSATASLTNVTANCTVTATATGTSVTRTASVTVNPPTS